MLDGAAPLGGWGKLGLMQPACVHGRAAPRAERRP